MLDALHALLDLTEQVVTELTEVEYEQLESLTDERIRVFGKLADPKLNVNAAEKEEMKRIIAEIMRHDSLIIHQMERLKLEAEEGLKNLKKLKQQKHAYEAGGPADSMFFDERK